MTDTRATSLVSNHGGRLQAPFTIPVIRPRLPSTACIAPYLQCIDQTQTYSNYGPLILTLERRLEEHFGLCPATVCTVANATLGIALALMAQAPKVGTLCVIPAWTFVASAQAAVMAGLIPYFVDVDPETWALAPDRMDEILSGAPGEVSAVMPVAPFGQPINVAEWDRFRSETGLAVVVDGAATFDSLVPGSTPVVVSLHATKIFGVGEGGFVACRDSDLVADIRARANFGFSRTREAIRPGLNAKLSEYHAAVGLAGLDEWPTAREAWMTVASLYRRALLGSNRLQAGFGESWIASACVVTLRNGDPQTVADRLAAVGVDSRRWWGVGAHAHMTTAKFPCSDLSVTTELARNTIGVPFYRDLSAAAISEIAAILAQ